MRSESSNVLTFAQHTHTHTQNLYPTLSISIWLVKKKEKSWKPFEWVRNFIQFDLIQQTRKRKKNPQKGFSPRDDKTRITWAKLLLHAGGKKNQCPPSKRDWRKAVGKSQHQKDKLNGEGPLRKWLFTNSSSNNNGHTNKLHNHHQKKNGKSVDCRFSTTHSEDKPAEMRRERGYKKVN